MRFGLIGYGRWGKAHAQAILKAPSAVLAGIAVNTDETEAIARADFPDIPVYLDYHELLKQTDIEAIDVVAPNHVHAEIGIAVLESGKNLFIEKPMAPTIEECDRLIEAAKKNNCVLTVGHQQRLSTQWGRLKEIIEAGEIGEPQFALVSLFRHPYRQGAGGWRFSAGKVGSWILEEPVHFFDILMWYFKKWGNPSTVSAFGNSNTRSRDHGMYDNFSSIVRWPNNLYGIVTQTLAGFEHHQMMEIVGSEGAIRTWWSGATDHTRHPSFELKVKRQGQEESEIITIPPSGESFDIEEELKRVVVAFNEKRPIVSGEEARKCILVCNEAERSVLEGREIDLHF